MLVGGSFSDRWNTRFGAGETYNDDVLNFSFNINEKINIFVCGDILRIQDIRYSGKSDVWVYCNRTDVWPTNGWHMHELEHERIEKYLSVKIQNCKIWDMVSKKAVELYKNKIQGE